MPNPVSQGAALEQVIAEYQLAAKALQWMLEHRVYWDKRSSRLLSATELAGPPPLCEPPVEVAAYIHHIARLSEVEASLEAVSAR